jgi:Ca2+ transporting ATPase
MQIVSIFQRLKMKVEPSFLDQEIPHISSFALTVKDAADIVEAYRNRSLAEDVKILEELGGSNGLIEKLNSSKTTGLLSNDDHQERISIYGRNKPAKEKKFSYFELCWIALKDPTLRVLIVAGLISLIIGVVLEDHPEYAWIEGFAIIVAVVVVVNVGAINDYQKQNKFNDLKKQNRKGKQITILRDGNWFSVHPKVLLVGDIVKLENGITIPADGVLLEGSDVEVIEAAMTGENENIKKCSIKEASSHLNNYLAEHPDAFEAAKEIDKHHDIPSPVVLSGTNLAEGIGEMIVIAVGKNSAEGRIMELATQEESETPLMRKLNKLTETVAKIGIICALITSISLYIRFAIEKATGDEFDNGSDPAKLVKYFIIGITVLVVAIPEGLPLAVTISLAYSVKKMQKENNLVRKMNACETMGGADMICSDKTGTLTQNKMTVNEFWSGVTCYSMDKGTLPQKVLKPESLYLIKEAIFTNTSAYIDPTKGEQGSKSEIALILFMNVIGHGDYKETRQVYFERFNRNFPFSSKRKRSSIVITKEGGQRRVHLKGAAEIVLKSCKTFLTAEGETRMIDDESQRTISSIISIMTDRALRVLALAYKDLPNDIEIEALDENGFPSIENFGFTLLGFAGIRDPLRDEVPDAVKKCQSAGIKVRMVTGDNKATAKAIAKECHIITSDHSTVLEGKEFAEMTGGTVCEVCRTKICPCPRNEKEREKSDKKIRVDVVDNFEKFKEIVPNLAVLARSAPDDKYTLVTGLRQMGHVVAVTGDGTNDAPALRKADIGFAMGIAGTEMAKEAAGIILMDDNFTSIVRAVVWGRNIYDNIRSFLQFQITVNLVAVISAMVGAIVVQQSPLTSVQLLWVNLIMDSFASLALATDPPSDKHLTRKPYKRNEFIISKTMWKNVIGQSCLQLIIVFGILFAGEYMIPENDTRSAIIKNGDFVGSGRNYHFDGEKDYYDKFRDPDYGPSRHLTFIFNVFVLLQLTNEINSKKLRDEVNVFERVFSNWLFIVIILGTYGTQALIVHVTGYAFSVSFYGLSGYQWLICFALSTLSFIWRLFLLLIPSEVFPEVISKQTSNNEIEALSSRFLSFRSPRLGNLNSFK